MSQFFKLPKNRSTRFGVKGKSHRKNSSIIIKEDVTTNEFRQRALVATKLKHYMVPNVIFQLWEIYSAIDVSLGVFDVIYSQQSYSSYFCSVLWLKVEHIRFLLNTSITYKTKAPQTLLPQSEELLKQEVISAKIVFELLSKTLGEIMDYMAWNRNLRWERRFHLERVEAVYKQHWTELDIWQESISSIATNEQKDDLQHQTLSLDKSLKEKLKGVHRELNLVSKEAKKIQQLNDQTMKCIQLNIYMQYNEAQTLSCELFVVEEIEKFHSTYESKSNDDVKLIIVNAKRTIEESSHKSSLMKNKYDFQLTRVPSLGPFGLLKVPVELHDAFVIDIKSNQWRLHASFCDNIPGLRDIIDDIRPSTTSQLMPCPFKTVYLETLGISHLAKLMLYLSPISINDQAPEIIKLAEASSPIHVLALYGGYAFFDQEENLVSLHGLGKGCDVFFTLPLFRNLQLRQYRFKDDDMKYSQFPAEKRLYNSGHLGVWAGPKDITPEEDLDEPNASPKWGFIFKDTVEEETYWPHYIFEWAPLPFSVLEAKGKKYKPSPALRGFKKSLDDVRDYWSVSFPVLRFKNRT